LKLSSDPPLKVLDYFTPADTRFLSDQDIDLGSGGAMLLPDLVDSQGRPRHLAIGAGKDLNIYVVDRDDMGKFQSGGDKIYQEVGGSLGGGVFSNPAFWDGAIYYGAAGDSIKSFSVAKASLQPTPLSMTSNKFNYPGATPTISASGTSNGILWAVENDSAAGVLHAYDAHDLTQELYNSNRALNRRDKFPDNKYVLPLVANGKVYVGTPDSVAVFGLLVE
jgi:hypothetical protein